jgi:kynureninase
VTPWKAHFATFLGAEPGRLHFAAHSHHPWPDLTLQAQEQAWLDAATLADDKWEHIFGAVWPQAQSHVAAELHLPDPSTVVFAPNTHSLLLRILSCLPERPRIVTSDCEFHSFERQARRLEEDKLVRVDRVRAEPSDTFTERLLECAAQAPTDLLFVSHVFFNSGAVVQDLPGLVGNAPAGALVVIDGYHGFCAVPTDLSRLADRVLYLAGGYKYAMSGEGVCFAHVPPQVALRPRDTGWFAAFGQLQRGVGEQVPYAKDAMRLMGATFDPTALYRFNAVMGFRAEQGLTTQATLTHAHALQQRFVEGLGEGPLRRSTLRVDPSVPDRGRFLTFRTPGADALVEALRRRRVITDARLDRLRFGFGPYQDAQDVDLLLERLGELS